MKNYDVIWIGTGQATSTVVPRLADAGKTVAIIEGDRVGGTCVNYGCTPTKTLVASARAAHMARRGADFGVNISDFSIDFSKVMQRQNNIRHGGSKGLENWLVSMEGVDLYKGYAEFESDHQVRIGDEIISGETIALNVGTSPITLPIPGLTDVPWLDNARLLDLEELPQNLLVVGGSYIGMEFAQAFRRLGSEVTIIEAMPQLMSREDADIAQAAQGILESEGIEVILGAKVQQVAQDGDIEVSYELDGVQTTVAGSHVLVAVGRAPNSSRLNLGAAGVQTNERGFITVNDIMQTNIPHIYAIGDVNGEGAFTHTSVNDGEIFWDNYSGENDRKLSDRIITYAMYIDPALGRVGMSEKEARESGRNVLMATRQMEDIGRAKEKDETAGLIKILVDADTEEFLGAAVLGIGGDEIINMFTPYMYTKQSYKLFRRAVLTHPTVSELIPWILDDLEPLK
ncbi:MAG: pyruvate/2-oxoglutarate dehydrogenase complex dihydrolipoamide dehydrogenase (E3) component [Candidatus Latescibacterota bacterium]|jgi:pyruvate/2-oxoglutarate dehydrogenase complex dihydrolipoamide dehydrogenase (E3) component